jgi:hypothetical protein
MKGCISGSLVPSTNGWEVRSSVQHKLPDRGIHQTQSSYIFEAVISHDNKETYPSSQTTGKEKKILKRCTERQSGK